MVGSVNPMTAAPIDRGVPSDVIYTDNSDYAWSRLYNDTYGQSFVTPQEADNIIAYKELLAIYYALHSFRCFISGSWILFRSDNVTAVAYFRDMGGMKNIQMDTLAKKIWNYAIQHHIWLSASFVHGHDNAAADLGSRILLVQTEWCLPTCIFIKLQHTLLKPSIDLFASRLNAKLDRYVSWIPDPYCVQVDAFLISWTNEIPYLFRPFTLLHRYLQKIRKDAVQKALVIFPL